MYVDWIPIGECDIQAYTANEKAALEILNEGKNYFHIAYRLHVSFERAREIVFSIRKKESIIMGKLSNTERAAIYQAWKGGTSQADLARQYGVSKVTLCNLIKKLTAAEKSLIEAKPLASKNLEDCENGIPNTPLVPAEIEKEISAIAEEKSKPGIISPEDVQFASAVNAMIAQSRSADAEEKSANAEPDKLPHFIWVALDDQVSAINWEIEQREQRIAELKEELVKLEDRRSAIEQWVEEQKWQ